MNIIYVDVLIAINIFVNYFLLLASSGFLHIKTKKYRLLIGALIGGFASIIIFLGSLHPLILLAFKIVLCFFIVVSAFGFKSVRMLFRTCLVFIAVSFAFAGIMMLIFTTFNPNGMYYKNGVVYFDISAMILCICCVIAYFAITAIEHFTSKRVLKKEIYPLYIKSGSNEVLLQAFVDSGNKLCDPFTNKRVIVCELSSLFGILPKDVLQRLSDPSIPDFEKTLGTVWEHKFKLIPYKAVGKDGFLLAFSPELIYIEKENEKITLDSLIGISKQALSDGEYNALLYDF